MPLDQDFLDEIKTAKLGERPKFELLSHEELLVLDVPMMMWVMNMVIPSPGLVAISGKPGSYKTFFALWMGLRASNGLPLFDEETFCPREGANPMGKVPTLFVEEENSKSLMKERARGLRPSASSEMYYLIDEGFQFTNDLAREELLSIIESKKIKMLIFDPFTSVMALRSENDNAEVSMVMDIIRKEFVKRGLTVVFIHHPSKGDEGAKNLRGAGDILGKCDVHLALEVENEDEKLIKVSYEKLRVADKSKVSNFKMRLMGDSLMRDLRFQYGGEAKTKVEEEREELKEKILSSMVELEEYTQKEVADRVEQKPNNKKFISAWSTLEKESKIFLNPMTKKYRK